MFAFIPYKTIANHMNEIIQQKVSIRAREEGQFLDMYSKYGIHLPQAWQVKRNNFIKRTYAAFKLNPTKRRYLSLICWSFQPK